MYIHRIIRDFIFDTCPFASRLLDFFPLVAYVVLISHGSNFVLQHFILNMEMRTGIEIIISGHFFGRTSQLLTAKFNCIKIYTYTNINEYL